MRIRSTVITMLISFVLMTLAWEYGSTRGISIVQKGLIIIVIFVTSQIAGRVLGR